MQRQRGTTMGTGFLQFWNPSIQEMGSVHLMLPWVGRLLSPACHAGFNQRSATVCRMRAINEFSLLCCLGVAASLLPSLLRGVLFAWHPLLMVVGYVGLMTDGILGVHAVKKLVGQARVDALRFHGYMQMAAAASASLGFLAIYLNKERLGKSHLTSQHGQLGFLVLVSTLASLVLGVCSFRPYNIITRFPLAWQAAIKRTHRLVSRVTWLAALADMQLVLPHPLVLQGLWCRLWQACVAFIAAGVIFATLFPEGEQHVQATKAPGVSASKASSAAQRRG